MFFDISEAPDGKLIVGGGSFAQPNLMLLDSTYSLEWDKTYQIPNSIDENRIFSICADSEGHIYALGNNHLDIMDVGTWILKTNPTGSIEWITAEKFGGFASSSPWHKIEIVNDEVHALFGRYLPNKSTMYAYYTKNGTFLDTTLIAQEPDWAVPVSHPHLPDNNGWFFRYYDQIAHVDYFGHLEVVHVHPSLSLYGPPQLIGEFQQSRFSMGFYSHPTHNTSEREVTYSKIYKYNNNWQLVDSFALWHDSTLLLAPDTLTDVSTGLTDAVCHPTKGIIGIYSAAIGNEHPRIGYPSLVQIDPMNGTVINSIELTGDGKRMVELHVLHDKIIGSTNLTGYSFGLDLFEINFPDLPLLSSSQNDKTIQGVTQSLRIYPNPVNKSNSVTIDIEPIQSSNEELKIYDTHGRLVDSMPVASPGRITIPTSDLSLGVYFIHYAESTVKLLVLQE